MHDFQYVKRKSLKCVKLAAVKTNQELGEIDIDRSEHIAYACNEILKNKYMDQFLIDMIQGGAGTSTNMNMNEVIANIANEHAGRTKGSYHYIHPNDHVNKCQSTNDVYPTAIRLAVLKKCQGFIKEQKQLSEIFREKAAEFKGIIKVGRTQLQDAVPITLGHEFLSFASSTNEEINRLLDLTKVLKVINLGGTAVGTGINTPANYSKTVTCHLSKISGYELSSAQDLIDASSDMGALVSFSGLLRRVAIRVSKICNDLRLLSCGPRAGIGEIILPAVQAGSSIMPGKVNPVIPEVVNQVAYEVVGNDVTITMAAESGQLQLNAMEPVVAYNLLDSFRIMTNAIRILREKCIKGIKANEARCSELFNNSLVVATTLVPIIGYENASQVAKKALSTGQTIGDVAIKDGLILKDDYNDLINKCLTSLLSKI
ncbi:aspartate ammonia-lyase [Desulfococcaceae bacterium HSG9]|nr:aspartate ammonia-lyase [Desulfococcaceae bacterium HSG9]